MSSVTSFSSMSVPLFQGAPDDVLYDALLEVMKRTPILDSSSRQNTRRGFLVVATVISGMTKYFFIPYSMKLPAGTLWAAGNCCGWFFLEFGFAYRFIQNAMRPSSENEQRLLQHCSLGNMAKSVLAICSFVLGGFSQLTAALQAVQAAPHSKFLVISVTTTSTAFYPAVSTQEGIVAMHEKWLAWSSPATSLELKVKRLRLKMMARIQANHIDYQNMRKDEKFLRVLEFQNVKNDNLSDRDKFVKYMTLMMASFKKKQASHVKATSIKAVVAPKTNAWTTIGTIFKKATALFLTATAEVCGCLYTVEYAKQSFDYDNDPFARGMSALYAGSGLYITWKLNDWMIQHITETMRCKRQKSTAEQIYPWATNALVCMALIVDFLSQGSVWQIWHQFSQEKNYQNSELFFQITQCAETFLILFASTLGVIQVGLEFYNQNWGSVEAKEILLLDQEFQKITDRIEKSSFLHFCIYLSNLPNELKAGVLKDLLEAHKTTMLEVQKFISEKFGSTELALVDSKHAEP